MNYIKDICIKICGFIPLGFFLYGYFRLLRRVHHPIAAMALVFAASLTIEVLQASLPTRDSSMTDLLMNTFGIGVGAVVSKDKAVQGFSTALHFRAERWVSR